jgi:hypothetical protein
MRLLVRRRWLESESWPGYLLRLAEANGLAGIGALARLAGTTKGRILVGEPRHILAALGVEHDGVPHIGAREDLVPRGASMMRQAKRSFNTAVCPACLRTDLVPVIRARWEFPMEVACHVHHVTLATRCPGCDRPLRVDRPQLLQCPCGFLLSKCRTAPAPTVVGQLQKLLGIDHLRATDLTFQCFTDHEAAAMRLVERLSHQSRHGSKAGLEVPKKAAGQRLKSDDLAAAEEWFADWPEGFKRLYALAMFGDRPGPKRFLTARKLELARFPLVFEVANDVHFGRLTRRHGRPPLAQQERVGIVAAMELSGVPYERMLSWIRSGALGEVRTLAGAHSTAYKISREKVVQAAALIKRTLSVQEAANEIGLPTFAVCKLIRAGILSAVLQSSRADTARLEPAQLKELALELKRVSTDAIQSPHRLSFGAALVMVANRRGDDAVRSLVTAVLNKELTFLAFGQDAAPLKRAYVDIRQIAERFRVFNRAKPVSS